MADLTMKATGVNRAMYIESEKISDTELNGAVSIITSDNNHYEIVDLDYLDWGIHQDQYELQCFDLASRTVKIRIDRQLIEQMVFGDVVPYRPKETP